MSSHSIELHLPRLRRYALALARDHARADDLVQDTVERALRKFSLWRRGTDLRAWLFTIMHNLYLNQIRDERAAAHTPLSDDVGELAGASAHTDRLEIRDLGSALQRLSPEFREVILLVGLEQLSYQETAAVLGVPVGTVMSRLARARERLRALLEGGDANKLRRVK